MVGARAWPLRPRWDQGTCGTDDLQQHTQYLLGGKPWAFPRWAPLSLFCFGAVAGMTSWEGRGRRRRMSQVARSGFPSEAFDIWCAFGARFGCFIAEAPASAACSAPGDGGGRPPLASIWHGGACTAFVMAIISWRRSSTQGLMHVNKSCIWCIHVYMCWVLW